MKKILMIIAVISLLFNNTVKVNAQIVDKSKLTDLSASQSINTSESSKPAIANREPDTSPWPNNGPDVASKAAIVMEASTGAILYAKNIHHAYYPASITKILTALLAIENSSLGETVTFSKNSVYDVEADSSRLWINVGEELTMEQCLYGMMLESANDVAYAIAEHVSGNIDSFAKRMNEKATELGCVDSNFVNPHGLPDPKHYTSAYDMALISRAAINNKTFREVCGTRFYEIQPTNLQKESRYLINHHKFIKKEISFDGCIGGKTGYTTKANYTLVTFAERNGVTLISVILNCDSITNEYQDTANLLNYGFNNYHLFNIAEMEEPGSIDTTELFTKYSTLFNSTNSRLKVSQNGNIILPKSVNFKDAEKQIIFSPISNIVEGDNVIGSIQYSYKGIYVGSADIIFNNTKSESLLEGSYVPSPAAVNKAKENKAANQSDTYDLRPVIISIIIGIIVLVIGAYLIFVELPLRRRRNNYNKKKKRNKLSKDDSYLDL